MPCAGDTWVVLREPVPASRPRLPSLGDRRPQAEDQSAFGASLPPTWLVHIPGLEPGRPEGHHHLKVARLPFRQTCAVATMTPAGIEPADNTAVRRAFPPTWPRLRDQSRPSLPGIPFRLRPTHASDPFRIRDIAATTEGAQHVYCSCLQDLYARSWTAVCVTGVTRCGEDRDRTCARLSPRRISTPLPYHSATSPCPETAGTPV